MNVTLEVVARIPRTLDSVAENAAGGVVGGGACEGAGPRPIVT